jgi:hypothetical protein
MQRRKYTDTIISILICAAMIISAFFMICNLNQHAVLASNTVDPNILKIYDTGYYAHIRPEVIEPIDFAEKESTLFMIRYRDRIMPSDPENIRKANVEVNILLDMLEPSMTDVERVDMIAEWVADKLSYKKETVSSGLADSIVTGEGVCWHYAYIFQIICESAGIPCTVVEGDKGNSRHAWNKLEINDKTWYFDLTFEDYFYPRTGKYCWMTQY